MELVVQDVASVRAELPWAETLLVPLGDIQLGAGGKEAGECDTDLLKRTIAWGMEHNAYFLGMGDYVDVASPSNRKALQSARLYDSVLSTLEEAAEEHLQQFLGLVSGTEGRWLGLLEGHHYYSFQDGTTSDTRIASALKTSFLGTCAFVRLRFPRPSGHGFLPLTIWCHHGQGGGIKVSAPLNKLENLVHSFDADIYLIGHQHKVVAAPIQQIYMTRSAKPELRHHVRYMACTGSYLRGYQESSRQGATPRGNYVERAMLAPVALGSVAFHLQPVHRDHEDVVQVKVTL